MNDLSIDAQVSNKTDVVTDKVAVHANSAAKEEIFPKDEAIQQQPHQEQQQEQQQQQQKSSNKVGETRGADPVNFVQDEDKQQDEAASGWKQCQV